MDNMRCRRRWRGWRGWGVGGPGHVEDAADGAGNVPEGKKRKVEQRTRKFKSTTEGQKK